LPGSYLKGKNGGWGRKICLVVSYCLEVSIRLATSPRASRKFKFLVPHHRGG
jgi:hypothetical protein